MTVNIFSDNITALQEWNPEAASVVAECAPSVDVMFETAANGELSAAYKTSPENTIRLHSSYDPTKEARRFVDSLRIGYGKWVVWLGPGLWYGIRAVMKCVFHSPVCVVEADPALLRAVMECMPLQDVFSRPGLRVLTGTPDAMRAALSARPVPVDIDAGGIVDFRPATAGRLEIYAEIRRLIEQNARTLPTPHDPRNVVPLHAFRGANPRNFRMVIMSNCRYSDAAAHVLEPLGATVRNVMTFRDTRDVAAFRPTCVLTFTYNFTLEVFDILKSFKARGIPLIVWNMEDPKFFINKGRAALILDGARAADLFFTHSEQCMDRYAAAGKPVYYLPTGARPEMRGDPLPEEALEYDYSFFGTLIAARSGFFDELAHRLPGLASHVIGPGLPPEDYKELIRRTRVNLSSFTTCDAAGAQSWALSDRVWEIPYAGGFLLQDQRRHTADHFTSDEAVTFTDAAGAAEKILYFATHPEERRRILDAARARIAREHLMAHRVAVIVEKFFSLFRD